MVRMEWQEASHVPSHDRPEYEFSQTWRQPSAEVRGVLVRERMRAGTMAVRVMSIVCD